MKLFVAEAAVGVPERTPLAVLKVRPGGSGLSICQVVTFPPVTVGVNGVMGLLT
jgi:hypothetical protein